MNMNNKKMTPAKMRILLFAALLVSHFSFLAYEACAAGKYDNPDTIVVARDGTGEFRTVDEAIEVCRAFMDYHKVIFVKRGTYKEKLIIPQWLQNIEICGEDRDQTVITFDDHANIKTAERPGGMGTFRTYTLKIEGNDITLCRRVCRLSYRLGLAVHVDRTCADNAAAALGVEGEAELRTDIGKALFDGLQNVFAGDAVAQMRVAEV